MREVADRIARTVSDATVGVVIVMVHAALAERQARRERAASSEGGHPRRRGRTHFGS